MSDWNQDSTYGTGYGTPVDETDETDETDERTLLADETPVEDGADEATDDLGETGDEPVETEDTASDKSDDDTGVVTTKYDARVAAAKALLAQLEAEQEAERKRKAEKAAAAKAERERKAAEREAKRDAALAETRGAYLKRLYAAVGVEPVTGDRGERQRFAALLDALGVVEDAA